MQIKIIKCLNILLKVVLKKYTKTQ